MVRAIEKDETVTLSHYHDSETIKSSQGYNIGTTKELRKGSVTEEKSNMMTTRQQDNIILYKMGRNRSAYARGHHPLLS